MSLKDPTEVRELISGLKNSAACGPDQVPVSVIKSVSKCISPVLSSIINHSIQQGIFPDALKVAKVIPIYKCGEKSLLANYRPISILNTFSKIFEKVILKRLENYLDKKQILHDAQYGFRKNRSTQLAIVSFLDKLTDSLDKGKFVFSLFIDLSKAFDTIDHVLLLNKLHSYGIRGVAYNLISSYLTNRLQYVELFDIKSQLSGITCGVPQGSILGPMLFLLYINDLPLCTRLIQFFLFADDTTVLFSCDRLEDLIEIVNRELLYLTDWFSINKLSLNLTKTNYMLFSGHNLLPKHDDVFLCNHSIKQVQLSKFLGIEIDEKLTWKHHIQTIQKKLSTANYILRSIRYKINQATALKIYDIMILPHLAYCNIIWGNACKTFLLNIHRLQKRALKVCCDDKKVKSESLFVILKKLTVKNINCLQLGQLVHRYYYNLSVLPLDIASLFEKSSDVHSHRTRA